jgi:hypothetical protein
MKAVTGNELGAQPALRDDLPAPTPGAGEVLPTLQRSGHSGDRVGGVRPVRAKGV